MLISQTEENYLKAIFKISEHSDKPASTNQISKEIKISAASVTDMLKRLSEKGLINYEKYKGVTLTAEGNLLATNLIRRHRLWEVFLVDKLNFSWDQVHDIAEELEHIKSDELIKRLNKFLGQPKYDPHGDPIPDENGKFVYRNQTALSALKIGETGVVVGLQEHSTPLLKYLDQLKLGLGSQLTVVEQFDYDHSIKVKINKKEVHKITQKVAQNLFVQKTTK